MGSCHYWLAVIDFRSFNRWSPHCDLPAYSGVSLFGWELNIVEKGGEVVP